MKKSSEFILIDSNIKQGEVGDLCQTLANLRMLDPAQSHIRMFNKKINWMKRSNCLTSIDIPTG